ncbi:hypothetical protein T492DRAFT_916482 [Pavlovales sp. CCMP2436]|nr:hypothetical protein T492DRAFT_916482 [Pavlovales sp. CCMP2436]
MLQAGEEHTPATRGNEGPARQDLKPTWLGQQAYLAFCGLRAWPNRQMRALAAALHDNLLPLERVSTHALLLQALYHVGELRADGALRADGSGRVRMAWKGDLLEGSCDALAGELEDAADVLAEQPQAFSALLVLGCVAAYLGGLGGEPFVFEAGSSANAATDRCLRCARTFSATAMRWARELDEHLAAAETNAAAGIVDALRAKQHAYLSVALVCYGTAGALDAADAASICALRVQIHATEPLLGQAAQPQSLAGGELVQCAALAQTVMAARVHAICALLDGAALTAAVSCVLHEGLLAGANWSAQYTKHGIRHQVSCFHAETAAGAQVSINALSGVVLANGLPPNHLPATIISHSVYKRTFGERNCTVVPAIELAGALTTTRPLAGRNYTFFFTPAGELVVYEAQPAEGGMPACRYRLLPDPASAEWAQPLPVQLREMYSHWVSDSAGGSVIVLCPINYALRAASFLVVEGGGASGGPQLYRVPESMASHHPRLLAANAVSTLDKMVVCGEGSRSAACMRVLAKLEDARFLEVHLSPERVFSLRLPRHELEFELRRGAFHSVDHRGYELTPVQQLADLLAGFSAYLLLRCSAPRAAEVIGRPRLRILVNRAQVCADGCGVATAPQLLPAAWLRCNTFDVHSCFGTLVAPDVASRLQLAALYAATGTLLPEQCAGMTGAEHAVELVRQCWQNKPLSAEERTNLGVLASFASRAPALVLLCDELERSSCSLEFLYAQKDASIGLPATDVTCVGWRLPRALETTLDAAELAWERRVSVSAVEDELESWTIEQLVARLATAFPLEGGGDLDRKIGRRMLASLRDSWDAHNRVPSYELARSLLKTRGAADIQLESVRYKRLALYRQIEACLRNLPLSAHWHACGFALRRAANDVPVPTQRDVVHASWEPELLRAFNPFLSPAGVASVRSAVLDWMQLCVLEDRLARVVAVLADDGPSSRNLAVRELRIRRTWDLSAHSQWLALEVEGCLQIRPEQHAVIVNLLEEPGRIAQLNMGLGKTRVVVPYLLLHWAQEGRGEEACVVRLYFLAQLLDEGSALLHRTLTADVLGRKIFHMPFCRDVVVSEPRTRALLASLRHCRRSGGALVLAPEHRLSMLLKALELGMSPVAEHQAAQRGLGELERLRFVDLFDESDSILSHRRQLIYAVGLQNRLQGGKRRWQAIMAVLHVVRTSPRVQELLRQDENAVWAEREPPHRHDKLRLVADEELARVLPLLYEELTESLFQDPPHSLRWMEGVRVEFPVLCDQIKRAATDASVSFEEAAPDLVADSALAGGELLDDVLAIRGLLAHGVLAHCLQKRHRVEFGVARAGAAHHKRLAVPFVAADTPSQRSEFSQPDVALIFTVLAYYSDGLSHGELRQAFDKLLATGPVARKETYAEWFEACAQHEIADEAERASIDLVTKIDLSNSTAVFPHRLLATPWHLCAGAERRAGFSGTNDLALLMPLAIRQSAAMTDELLVTDGLMLARILELAKYELLRVPADVSATDAVIEYAASNGLDALVDVGAFMAGRGNEQVAIKLVEVLRVKQPDRRAVAFFDTAAREWVVLDTQLAGRRWPLRSSPIVERHAFCYYDQDRCRGVDLKLAPDAVALITLSPRLRKDELMQAAGRLRGLAFGQRLRLVAQPEADARVRSCASVSPSEAVTPAHVLAVNSAVAAATGLAQWTRQGAHFATTSGESRAALLADHSSLHDLYAHANASQAVSTGVDGIVSSAIRHRQEALPLRLKLGLKAGADASEQQLHTICTRGQELGADVYCVHSSSNDEAEREVELEVEEEEEEELEVPREEPAAESDWDFASALTATTPAELPAQARLRSLAAHWPAPVLVTANFATTTQAAALLCASEQYLRAPDAVLIFPCGLLVLVSERECDRLLPYYWAKKRLGRFTTGLALVNFAFIRAASEFAARRPPAQRHELLATLQLGYALLVLRTPLLREVAGLQLFAGETRFPTEMHRAALRVMVGGSAAAANAASGIPSARGMLHLLDRSDMQDVLDALKISRNKCTASAVAASLAPIMITSCSPHAIFGNDGELFALLHSARQKRAARHALIGVESLCAMVPWSLQVI